MRRRQSGEVAKAEAQLRAARIGGDTSWGGDEVEVALGDGGAVAAR